jgi:hypothetical protein
LIGDNSPQELIIFPAGKKLPVQDFLRKGLIEVHPFIGKYFDTMDFGEFFNKYSLVVRELICKSLRNKARQRRSIPKYYEDFSILFNDANAYDNQILSLSRLQPKEGNTVALTMVINLSLTNSLELLTKGFDLDLYSVTELPMIFSYLKYLYTLLVLNRKSMVLGMAGNDIPNLEDMSQSSPKFLAKRAKFSSLQKLMCDEFELFQAL